MRIAVLKLGGSVLRSEADLPRAVHELYRWIRRGERVVAVVSALEGATDALFGLGRRFEGERSPAHLAALVATGEATSAALLGLAAERAGIRCAVLDARRAGLRARGDALDAELEELDRDSIERALERAPLAVLPGFVGCGADGAPKLLGRGGSDLSALFVARELRAARCALVKDVDGLYERDPRRDPSARRFATIRFEDALRLDGEILQAKAARFAAEARVAFEVRALAAPHATRVGADATRFAASDPPREPLRVGLLGLGTVGLGVAHALRAEPERFVLAAALARTRAGREELGSCFTTRFEDVLGARCDALVDCIGNAEPALGFLRRALGRGVDAVTADKALVCAHGPELLSIARRRGARFSYSACAGGALPAVELARRAARRGALAELEGVLNGTTSFVLDEIARGLALDEATALAVERGFAERDPSRDLSGEDAAHKLAILARECGATELEWVERRGVDGIDPRSIPDGTRWRLVARASFDGARARLSVAPEALAPSHPLFDTEGAGNALRLRGADGTEELAFGRGAGRWPTAEAVLADLGDLARRSAMLGARAPVERAPLRRTSRTRGALAATS